MNKIITLCLFLSFTLIQAQTQKVISSDWTSFNQTIDIQTKVKKKFKVIASVKLETTEPKSWAGVWARVDTKNEEEGFFDNMQDRPIKSKEWNSYTIEGTIDENSKSLSFGGLCLFNGKFYFDKFELLIENEKGVLNL
ncbi:hypothetical protein EV144_102787 [Flavobacterium sp. 270]|uniref:hypothetical protein n=1 Tax=Flavobacterium sp. 270 TaxID=2512114 RepID=UPI0010F23304|nr:hypothetical protein [Flavobacterium sp. 270]TDW50348.1 hypothetical protein EV144_102787 [Flavobacterium sp. 270]